MPASSSATACFITPAELLEHWQAHRRLTRRMIEAFPEDKFASFSIGGMRTFADLAREMLGMAEPTVRGILTGEWTQYALPEAKTRAAILTQWDETTKKLEELWPRIPAGKFHESMTAFEQWTMSGYALVLYIVDNEIHHRGQGYVYLRALGIEPPPFWERT